MQFDKFGAVYLNLLQTKKAWVNLKHFFQKNMKVKSSLLSLRLCSVE